MEVAEGPSTWKLALDTSKDAYTTVVISTKASMDVSEGPSTFVEAPTTPMELSTTSMEASTTSVEASNRF